MAALDFPLAPTVGDEHTQNGVTYTWNGSAWVQGKSQIPPLPPSVQIKRTPTNNNPPPNLSLKEGELAIEMGTPLRLWVGVPPAIDASGKKLVAFMGAGDPYVDITGDTMTGDLAIMKDAPKLTLNRLTVAGGAAEVISMLAGVRRWAAQYGDATAEAGANAGSLYKLIAYDDAGVALPPALTGNRATNRLAVAGNPIAALDIATKQYVDSGGAAATPIDALAYSGMQVNGDFSVSIENAYTAVACTAVTNKYVADLYLFSNSATVGQVNAQQILGGSVNPGFNHTLRLTVATAFTFANAGDVVLMGHWIEGNRFQRNMWGLGASAKSIAISFWVMSAVTPGVMSVACRNNATNRTYITELPLAGGAVWEYKSFIVPGCPDGVWETDIFGGVNLIFCFGAGSGARAAPNAWNATANFIGTGVTNLLTPINQAIHMQGLTVMPGAVAPTAAQSPNISRNAREEARLMDRYLRRHNWSLEGYCTGANTRVTINTAIPKMRNTPTSTRLVTGSHVNIRGGDPATYVTVSAVSDQNVNMAIEAGAAGLTQAVNFAELLSARIT